MGVARLVFVAAAALVVAETPVKAVSGRGRRTPVPMMFSSPVRYKTLVFRDLLCVLGRSRPSAGLLGSRLRLVIRV